MTNREEFFEAQATIDGQLTMLTDFEAREEVPSSNLLDRAEALQTAYDDWYNDPLLIRLGNLALPWYKKTREEGIHKRAFFAIATAGMLIAAAAVKAPKVLAIAQQKRAFKAQLREECPYLLKASASMFGNDLLPYDLAYYADELSIES